MLRREFKRISIPILCIFILAISLFGPVTGQGFEITYEDPEADVDDLEGHVYREGHEFIDILGVSSEENILKTQLILKLTVKGVITDSENIIYYFNLLDSGEIIYMIYYSNGECMGLNFNSESEPENPQATGANTDTLEVRIQISDLDEVEDFDLYGQTSEDFNEGEQFLMDVAPDSAFDFDDDFGGFYELPVVIEEPKNGSTVSGPVNIEGMCDTFYDMESVEIQFDSRGDWIGTSSSDNWTSWTHSFQSRDLADGKHNLQVRAYDGSDYYYDSITIFVDQSNAVSPRTMNTPQLKIGSELHYSMIMAMPDFGDLTEGMEMEQTSDMVMTVIKKENVNVDGNDYEAYVIDVSMEMTMTMTFEGETITTKVTGTGTQWTRVSDLATIKVESETVSISFGSISTSKSEMTYNPPLDGYDFPMSIAEKWTEIYQVTTKETYYYGDEPEIWGQSYESSVECEALHVEEVTVPAGTYETFAIWSREGGNEYSDGGGVMFMGGSPGYSVNYLSSELGFPVKSQQFYPNRELYMTMELESYSETPTDSAANSKTLGGDLPFYYLIIPVLIAVILAFVLVVRKRRKGDETESWDQYSAKDSEPVVSQAPQTSYGAIKTKVPPYPPPPPSLQTKSPEPAQKPAAVLPQTTCPRCNKSFFIEKGATTITCPHCGVSGKLVH